MAQNYKIRNMLKSLPFYSDQINKIKKKKKDKKFTNGRILSELPFFPIINYQKRFHSFQKDPKDRKD